MGLKDFFMEGKQRAIYGDRYVIILGPYKYRGGRKLLLCLDPWSKEELEFRKKQNLKEPYDGLEIWVPEDQLKK